MNRPVKLGIISDEFFSMQVSGNTSRLGGFGWAAQQVARCFREEPAQGVETVFLTGELRAEPGKRETRVHETRLILRQPSRLVNARLARRERINLLLTIDFNLDYRFLLRVMPRTPVVIWVRDPRSPADLAKIATVRIPGQESAQPQGIEPIDATSLAGVVRMSRWLRRPILFAATAPALAAQRSPEAYGVSPSEISFLPNPIDLYPGTVVKNPTPRVVFLARIDPYKRPWIYAKLAEQFPAVEFLFLGIGHFAGPGAWETRDLPSNVRLLGHVDGQVKTQLLSSAWVLVNTSIHEGLPVSFLESLACETPIVSCQDPEEGVSRFGCYVGRWDGTGMEALPAFADGLQRLLSDHDLRTRLGRAGRNWVETYHGRDRFFAAFDQLCARLGVAR